MMLVCITGIDGTGKTTLAQSTVRTLKQRGLPASYVYGRTYPILSRMLMAVGRMTLLRRDDQWRDYVQYNVNKKQTMRNPLLAGIYTSVVLLDYYAQIWCKLLMHYRPNRVIIADRYVYDTVISDLAVHLDYSHARALRIIAYGLRIVPMPTRTILIDIPADVAFARKDDVPHVEYLEERRSYYLSLQRRPEVRLFSGEVSRETLVNAVLKEIREVKEGING